MAGKEDKGREVGRKEEGKRGRDEQKGEEWKGGLDVGRGSMRLAPTLPGTLPLCFKHSLTGNS